MQELKKIYLLEKKKTQTNKQKNPLKRLEYKPIDKWIDRMDG